MRDTGDIVLPAFEMDCRDWVVVTPGESGMPEELEGSPVLAMLSTVVLGPDRFTPASAVLTVGLLDDVASLPNPIERGAVASQIYDPDDDGFGMRFLMPAPSGRIALLAEFSLPDGPDTEVVERIEKLMRSFRWAA